MAASSVEYRQEEIESNLILDLLLDSEPGSPLITKARSIIHGQDPGTATDDILNSESNTKDYDWLLSPPRNPASSLEMDEQQALMNRSLMSNGLPTSPESRVENPLADAISITNMVPKSQVSSNGVKSSSCTIRQPSPSRKAPLTVSRSATPTTRLSLPSTTKLLRSSTPTKRTTVSATKPVAPLKQSITPTPRSSALPSASKSTSRSSTPTARPSIIASAKSISRSSTPTTRPSINAAAKTTSRSSTPTNRPSINTAAKPSSRSSTPAQRPSNPSGLLNSSVNEGWASSAVKACAPSRGSSPSVKSKPSKNTPGYATVAPPTINKSLPEANKKAVPRRTSCSPARGQVSKGGANNSVKSGMTRSRGFSNGNDDVNPVVMGTKMVERVVNMRKLAPPREDHVSNQNNTSGKLSVSQDNSGFGRSLSKKSFDMALRHLDITRSMPGNVRAMITKVPGFSVYSVKSESTKTQTIIASDSPLATSSSTSSDLSDNGHSYHL